MERWAIFILITAVYGSAFLDSDRHSWFASTLVIAVAFHVSAKWRWQRKNWLTIEGVLGMLLTLNSILAIVSGILITFVYNPALSLFHATLANSLMVIMVYHIVQKHRKLRFIKHNGS